MTLRIKQQSNAMRVIRALCNAGLFLFVEIGRNGAYYIHSK